ncbi:Lipopolysaccharide biosynthesis protein WzxC [compost metagenome]
MEESNLQNKIVKATKWSAFTEILSKSVSPITNMILARILVPEAFGVVATITMIISFTIMFSDSGFQKYLVQHEFKDEDDKNKSATVAFWSNFIFANTLWLIIILFREQIAELVGNPGLGIVIAIACIQLPITSFSSIQEALFKRDFDFKVFFLVRIISVCVPFLITIPLALMGLSYWALIIGSLSIQVVNALILTAKSIWKPKFFFSIEIFKRMISFSIWSLFESVSIWLTTWVDTFIIAFILNQYYLGIYKTSTTLVNSLMAIITASIIPVLFSTLSRLQNNEEQFELLFFKFQRFVSYLVFPLGVGVFLFSDLVTAILLGSQWKEASDIIGIWALGSSIMIVLSNFSNEVYRAKGKPKLSFLAHLLHSIILIPVCVISSNYGFLALVYARSFIRLQLIMVHFILMKSVIGFSVKRIILNLLPASIIATLMGGIGYTLLQIGQGLLWEFASVIVCILFYIGLMFSVPVIRKDLVLVIKKFIRTSVVKEN